MIFPSLVLVSSPNKINLAGAPPLSEVRLDQQVPVLVVTMVLDSLRRRIGGAVDLSVSPNHGHDARGSQDRRQNCITEKP